MSSLDIVWSVKSHYYKLVIVVPGLCVVFNVSRFIVFWLILQVFYYINELFKVENGQVISSPNYILRIPAILLLLLSIIIL